jgi:hypothetical protein
MASRPHRSGDNQVNRKTIRYIAAAALITASFQCAAEDLAVSRNTGVGAWIAAQGNAALREIAEDVKRTVVEHLQLVSPAAPAPTPA